MDRPGSAARRGGLEHREPETRRDRASELFRRRLVTRKRVARYTRPENAFLQDETDGYVSYWRTVLAVRSETSRVPTRSGCAPDVTVRAE